MSYYGHVVEVRVVGGGIVNRIPYSTEQIEEKKRTSRDGYSFNLEGAINHAQRMISGWYASDQFIGKQLTWKVVK